MSKFKVGDIVRRIAPTGNDVVKPGSIHRIIKIRASYNAELVLDPDINDVGWAADNFVIVEQTVKTKEDIEALYG